MKVFFKDIFAYFKTHSHLLLLLYAFIYVPWFCYLEDTVTRKFHEIYMPVDDLIPFCEYFIIPYYLWFVYMAVGIAVVAFTDGQLCWRMGIFLIVGMTTFLLISTFYPNGHYLRPRSFEEDTIFIQLVRSLYRADTPTNLFPSIHVYNSLGIHFTIMHGKGILEKKSIRIGSFILMSLIILSTMFLKQHSVFDVITAFALASLMYSVCFGALSKKILASMQNRRPAGLTKHA